MISYILLFTAGSIFGILIIKYGSKVWNIWAKALGEKSGRSDRQADIVALVRTFIVLSYFITNGFIIAGVWRHW